MAIIVISLIRTTNRTNLELKPRWHTWRRCRGCLPIAPIWNWNEVVTNGSAKRVDYQSHQSGIETTFMGSWHDSQYFYQSHQSGIETEFITGFRDAGTVYQSHQSGIETFFSAPVCLQFYHTTNRTNLELKPESTLEQEANINTTNRTNLELKRTIWTFGIDPTRSTNRTNLELKRISKRNKQDMLPATNRTNLELKHHSI